MSDHFEGKLDITMVKAHCVVITPQVDMNFIVKPVPRIEEIRRV